MKRFLKMHQEWVLAAAGVILLGGIIACTVWTVDRVSGDIGKAISAGDQNSAKIEFRIDQFKRLDLRGLNVK